MTDRDALLAGIVADPREETRWLVLADWLQENDDPRRAELLRLHRKMLATCCEPDAHPERAAWQARMVDLLVAGVRPCVPQETLTLGGGVPMTFSFVPPGAFLMGSEKGEDEEKPVHRVDLKRGFFMSMSPVTQAQWKAVMGTDPSGIKGPNRPVGYVSWDDCRKFCAKVSKLVGWKTELPSESEWEYACRAGTTTEYFFGDAINTDFVADSPDGGVRERTSDAGSLPANFWGLCGIHGYVWEWCNDIPWTYAGGRIGATERFTQRHRAQRGGWTGTVSCRAARRLFGIRECRIRWLGFRACLRLHFA